MIGWWLLLALALAAPPDRTPVVLGPGGETTVDRLAHSPDRAVITGITDTSQVVVVDTRSWAFDTTSVGTDDCNIRSAAAGIREDGGHWIWIGCESGLLKLWLWQDDTLAPYTGAADGETGEPIELLVSDDPIMVVVPDANDSAFLLQTTGPTSLPLPSRVTVAGVDIVPDGTYSGSSGSHGGLDLYAVSYVDRDPHSVVLNHGGSQFSTWTLNTGVVASNVVTAIAVNPTDIAIRSAGGAHFVDESGGTYGSYNGAAAGQASVVTGAFGLGSPTAVLELADGNRSWLLVQEDEGLGVYADVIADDRELLLTPDWRAYDLLEGPDGYAFAGTDAGGIGVVTSRPWVSDFVLTPNVAVKGTVIEAAFVTDGPGSWSMHLGGDETGNGTSIASGSADEAGTQSALLTVDGSYDEGAHDIWVIQTDPSTGEKGYARTTLTVDNPPPGLTFQDRNVKFGDEALVVDFFGSDDEDITGYNVYISKEPFSASSFPSGGPEGRVDGVRSPVNLPQPDSGVRVIGRIGPLTNFQTYYLAVRAVDAAGEGPMSNVVQGMPRPTLTAADLAGEPGGPPCSTRPGSALGWLAVFGTLALARRRSGGALAALLVAGLASAPAQAQDRDDNRTGSVFEPDETPAWTNFEFHYGSFAFADPNLTKLYGDRAGLLSLQAGLQIFRYAEIDLGVGLLTKKGNTVDENEIRSAEEARLQWLPLSVGLTGRVHVIDEQPFVPYALVAFDYVFWRETPLDETGGARADERKVGSKLGWHWAAGGNILLDLFAPRQASQLEALTGINDTWLVVEYRRQYIGANGGLDLSGWSINAGLKLDY